MVQLHEILDRDLLTKHINEGNVSMRPHKELPLSILNYTPQCQYSRAWDDVTKKCRGLIYNYETGEVVARPFEKFFNWDESGAPFPPTGPALRMPKMDGSLGILYHYDVDGGDNHGHGNLISRQHYIATRGSMHSEQAEWATKFYNDTIVQMVLDAGCRYGEEANYFKPKADKTYLFEIIYPENRIVVDYGEYEGLVLIDVIDIATGLSDTDEFDNCAWYDKVVRKPVNGFDVTHNQDIPAGDEGFVYLWPTRNFRTKMKDSEYVRIHRLVSGLTEKSIWQHLVNGGTLDQLKQDLPEEFHDFIDTNGQRLMRQASAIVSQVYGVVDELCAYFNNELDSIPRKDIALWVKANHPNYAKYVFLVVDNRSVFEVALASVKPQREVSLVKED